MGVQASLALLLLAAVVTAPCTRKNFCVPTDPTAPHVSAPAREQQPGSVKPASGTPQPDHPCMHRAEMQSQQAGNRG